jgi:(p)ppGpp synthase/HD superfamily hydrolase
MLTEPAQLIEQAIWLAARAHAGQVDKGGLPYLLHPLAVMDKMAPDDIEGRIVAVLHDVFEDTNTSPDELSCFSLAVKLAINAITKQDGESNKSYWSRVKANRIALRVKLKDIEHNSSEARLTVLPKEEAEYLRQKYKKAVEYLLAT